VGATSRRTWYVIAGSLALLALLGTGPDADLLAHLFGFLVGGALGALAALTLRRDPPLVAQGFLGTLALAAVLGAWQLALQSSTWLAAG
jgi:hypothetical protein